MCLHLIHSKTKRFSPFFFSFLQSLVNLQRSTKASQDVETYEDMTFGNKIGLLIGDYLLSHSSSEMANLRNQVVIELISSTVRDFSESEFIGERDEQNNPLPSKPGTKPPTQTKETNTADIDFSPDDVLKPMDISKFMGDPEKEWEARNMLNVGSLLGKSCSASLKLAEQSEELQKKAYLFGKHLSLAWQACLDAEPFQVASLPYGKRDIIKIIFKLPIHNRGRIWFFK